MCMCIHILCVHQISVIFTTALSSRYSSVTTPLGRHGKGSPERVSNSPVATQLEVEPKPGNRFNLHLPWPSAGALPALRYTELVSRPFWQPPHLTGSPAFTWSCCILLGALIECEIIFLMSLLSSVALTRPSAPGRSDCFFHHCISCKWGYRGHPITPDHFPHPCLYVGSVMSDSATPWTVARQVPLSMEFSRQGYWSGLPFPIPGDRPDQGSSRDRT